MRHFVCAAILLLLPSLAVGQEKMITTPPALTVEGIPPIPQSIADGLARYAQFRQAYLQAWNPAKRQVLVSTAFGSLPQIHLVDGPGRDRRQLTWYGNGVSHGGVSPSFDPADGNTFVFQHDAAGGELRSLYRFDMATGEITLATASKTRYAHVWAKQGKWLAFDSAERNGRDRDLYVMQPSDPKTKRLLVQDSGPFNPNDWSPDGNWLLANEITSNTERYLWLIDVKSGQKRALTPKDGEKAVWTSARFSGDGRKVYAVSDRSGGDLRIWRCDIAACTWTPVTPEGVTVDSGGFELSSDGSMLAFAIDKGSHSELQVLDLTTLKPRSLPTITKGTVSGIQWRPGSREVGFTLASVKAWGDAYSVDTSLGTLTRWTTSETTFNPDVLPPPEVVEWKSFDGQISGILYRPAVKFSGPRPVLVQIHGGPAGRDSARWLGRSNYFLNEMGIAILCPNVRGSTGFGRKFALMDDGKLRGDPVKDIGAMLDWIAARPELDKNRVVLMGASYGGWLALQAGITYNDRIRGIVAGAAPTNLVTYLETTDAARQENRRREFGDERDPDMRAYLTSMSPTTRASELKKPTFILQGSKDIRVSVDQARELLKALKANNAPVWYAEFADVGHDGFPGPTANNDWMLASWMMFMKTFVLN